MSVRNGQEKLGKEAGVVEMKLRGSWVCETRGREHGVLVCAGCVANLQGYRR